MTARSLPCSASLVVRPSSLVRAPRRLEPRTPAARSRAWQCPVCSACRCRTSDSHQSFKDSPKPPPVSHNFCHKTGFPRLISPPMAVGAHQLVQPPAQLRAFFQLPGRCWGTSRHGCRGFRAQSATAQGRLADSAQSETDCLQGTTATANPEAARCPEEEEIGVPYATKECISLLDPASRALSACCTVQLSSRCPSSRLGCCEGLLALHAAFPSCTHRRHRTDCCESISSAASRRLS